ncbi:MAG: hypothetical protein Q4C47_03680 [Planctomycetia bacterium]|nr:hypothetical protein [Planctomycetia bacterium]
MGCLAMAIVFGILIFVTLGTFRVMMVPMMYRKCRTWVLNGRRWKILLGMPNAHGTGRLTVFRSDWLFARKMEWNRTTSVSLTPLYPSIRGAEHLTEIRVRTGVRELRLGRSVDPVRRMYLVAVLRAAIRGEDEEA